MGPAGAVSLDMKSIRSAMEDYNIDNDEYVEFSSKVRQIANIIISARHKEAERQAEEARKAAKHK